LQKTGYCRPGTIRSGARPESRAKARGVQLGRKPSITPAQAKHARKLIDGG
jgi:hypothetical protein